MRGISGLIADGIKFRGIMAGGVCDPSRVLISFVFRLIGLDDGVVGSMTSSVDINGGGDKGHRRRVGVFG